LTPGVKGIGGASLLADLGHEIPTSLLPSLLTSTLGAPTAALGLIEGVADWIAGAARFGGGVLGDDQERRRSVAVGGSGQNPTTNPEQPFLVLLGSRRSYEVWRTVSVRPSSPSPLTPD
jgi:hypothetical protein